MREYPTMAAALTILRNLFSWKGTLLVGAYIEHKFRATIDKRRLKMFLFGNVRFSSIKCSGFNEYSHNTFKHLLEYTPGGGVTFGQALLGMCRWPLRTPTPL